MSDRKLLAIEKLYVCVTISGCFSPCLTWKSLTYKSDAMHSEKYGYTFFNCTGANRPVIIK